MQKKLGKSSKSLIIKVLLSFVENLPKPMAEKKTTAFYQILQMRLTNCFKLENRNSKIRISELN